MFQRFHIPCLMVLILLGAGSGGLGSAVPLEAGRSGCGTAPALASGVDPEIDRSPVWAIMYGRYLYKLGLEMFWPDLDRKDRFRIAVVNWPDLASDLGHRLDGRAIAGLPVDIIPLGEEELANHRDDFTMVFLGGSNDDSARDALENALAKWMRKDRSALVVTDGASMTGHDLAFKRRKEGEGLSLCIAPDLNSLASKSLDLPPHFLQRTCP